MTFIKPIRIEPAFDDREQICAMFERHAPYRALATYAPEGFADKTREEAKRPVVPWFRGDWALVGKPLVEGAELILHNQKFLDAAKTAFATSLVFPEFVAVNISGPMPACTTHVDNPSFYGATRVDYPLPFLRVMGFSRLFDTWRVVQASVIAWFYEGAGGSFDYWPEGLDGPMQSEQPTLTAVAPGPIRARVGPASLSLSSGSVPVTYTPTFVYVADNGGTPSVSALSVNAASGALTAIAGSPFGLALLNT